jgi:N-acetylglucosaminyl-diphospho-decaprenol L-rhamnosyltransferase
VPDSNAVADHAVAWCGVVIVAHNNGATVVQTVDSVLAQQSPAARVMLIDCGSQDTSWLKRFEGAPTVQTIAAENVGYAGGNNLGWRELAIQDDGFVLFLNPDVLLPPDMLSKLRTLMTERRAQKCAMISPRLHGYDFVAARPTDRVDSTGIFPQWWGGWRDRRESSPPESDTLEQVPALCGACLWARVGALRAAALHEGEVFDPRYFAYKEDIELSLRLRRAGWTLGTWHGAVAWHGRGWSSERRLMPRALRVLSARNEVRLHATYVPARLPYSILKWAYAKWLER